MNNKKGIAALSPLIVFVAIYLVTSIIAHDFYKIPISIAFMLSCIYAVAFPHKETTNERIAIFNKGASAPNIMQMLWIFILAGAFANSAKQIGSIDATVNAVLAILPSSMVLPGLFCASCFISLSIGTSVGTIVALVPIATGLASSVDASLPLVTATVVGGAFFGDNLSFISDTTIAATSSQDCKMNDKFKANIYIAIPAAIITLIIYTYIGFGHGTAAQHGDTNLIKLIPYVAVLVTAAMGINVLTVLVTGIVLTLAIGIMCGASDIFNLFHAMGDGVLSMSELIIITMLAGGLFEVVQHDGGIDYIIGKITRRIHGKRGAEFVICFLAAAVDMCTANNTVAIITVGNIVKNISLAFGVDKRKAASLLDTSSCFMQGLIPYGAQLLMASGLAKLSPTDIVPYLYYPFILGAVMVCSILFRFPKKYS